ncbi:hypothetical protein QTP88_008327 [Uroleucon formosanum]
MVYMVYGYCVHIGPERVPRDTNDGAAHFVRPSVRRGSSAPKFRVLSSSRLLKYKSLEAVFRPFDTRDRTDRNSEVNQGTLNNSKSRITLEHLEIFNFSSNLIFANIFVEKARDRFTPSNKTIFYARHKDMCDLWAYRIYVAPPMPCMSTCKPSLDIRPTTCVVPCGVLPARTPFRLIQTDVRNRSSVVELVL